MIHQTTKILYWVEGIILAIVGKAVLEITLQYAIFNVKCAMQPNDSFAKLPKKEVDLRSSI